MPQDARSSIGAGHRLSCATRPFTRATFGQLSVPGTGFYWSFLDFPGFGEIDENRPETLDSIGCVRDFGGLENRGALDSPWLAPLA
jgi:hypothetical protein